jgi:hypothetical protein
LPETALGLRVGVVEVIFADLVLDLVLGKLQCGPLEDRSGLVSLSGRLGRIVHGVSSKGREIMVAHL